MTDIRVWRVETAQAIAAQARAILAADGVLAVPTETFYALAAHPFREEALKRLFSLKDRPLNKPVLLLVSGPEMLSQAATQVPETARRLMDAFWPGPLTLIVPARAELSSYLTGNTGTVGVRQPRQNATLSLLAALGVPLTGTSANRSGRPPVVTASEVAREFGLGVALIVDDGPCPGGLPSTIVDVSVTPPVLRRAGAVATAALRVLVPDLQTDGEAHG
jgi:L-threonylcarbamoyladenylate synthase